MLRDIVVTPRVKPLAVAFGKKSHAIAHPKRLLARTPHQNRRLTVSINRHSREQPG